MSRAEQRPRREHGTMTREECVDIAAKLDSYLHHAMCAHTSSGVYTVTSEELETHYNGPGGVGRWLQRLLKGRPSRATDVYWSWVAVRLREGMLVHTDTGPMPHPRIQHMEWSREVVNRSGWRYRLEARTNSRLLYVCSNIKDWLLTLGGCNKLPAGIDCTREVLLRCQKALYHTIYDIGGADTYWLCVLYMGLRGELVGDLRRHATGGRQKERVWLERAASDLLGRREITDEMYDRVLGLGKYESTSPPLPVLGEPYVLDLCCGYMSIYFDCLVTTNVGYVCVDWRRRLWSGTLHGWLEPHVCMDLRGEVNIVETICAQLGLSPLDCVLSHGSPPCSSHSTANGLSGENGLGLYGHLGQNCPVFQSELAVARAISASYLAANARYGTPCTIENSAYGTLRSSMQSKRVSVGLMKRLFGFLDSYEQYTVCYCSWGFPYQKPSNFYSTMTT